MLTGRLGLLLLLELTFALGSIRAAQQTGGSPASNPREQATAQANLVLKAGTRVQLRLAETLDSERGAQTSEGKRHPRALWTGKIEEVQFRVFREVRVGDLVVIERGAYASGSAELKQKASFGRNGIVRVTALRALAITGAEIPLRGNATEEGSSGCWTPECGLLVMFGVAGGDAVMPIGTKVDAYVTEDVSLDTAAVKKAITETEHRKALERISRRNQANLYIYRMSYDVDLSDFWQILAAMRDDAQLSDADVRAFSETSSVYLDGQEVVRIPEYGFILLTLAPGKHAIATDKSGIELDLTGGEDYYLRILGGSKKQLSLVSSDEGEAQIYWLEPVSGALRKP